MGIFENTPPHKNISLDTLTYLDNIHANSILFHNMVFLIKGHSGSGKSDLCLRMVEAGGTLISDDRTLIYTDHTDIYTAPHKNIAGQMEVRGIGIIQVPFINCAQCHTILELSAEYPRYPLEKSCVFYKKMLNYYKINPFERSILAKLKIIAHHTHHITKDTQGGSREYAEI